MKYSGQFRQNELRLVSRGSRTICKQRSRTKSSAISLKKKKSSMDKKLENVACCYSIHQNVKFKNIVISKRHLSQNAITRNSAKNTSRNSSSVAFVEKHPRSYAEIIADYSKAFYKECTSTQNNSLYFNNIMRQSPFGTSSIPPLSKKLVSSAEHDGILTKQRENHSIFLADDFKSINRHHGQENVNIAECHNFRCYDTCATGVMNRKTDQEHVSISDLKIEDQSYVKLVADCSKSMHINPNPGLIPSGNVLTRNSLELFGTPTRNASSTNIRETLQKKIPTIATIPFGGSIEEQTSDSKENDWLREIESVISDLRSASERKTARAVNVSKSRESNVLQSADASSNALDRIEKLAELMKAHQQKDSAGKKLGESKHFSNTAKSSSSKKNLSQMPIVSGTASVRRQPQVELRMVPSEKESVVSIDVDSASIGLSQDPVNPASKQLSVVVQSDRKKDSQPSGAQSNNPTLSSDTKSASQRNEFGPMRISISEDSAPVKQIEFSINGKPVSELKSITARTERLDVVSSMDKIEIRIPFAKDDASRKNRGGDVSKQTVSSSGQILNVHIAANFQNDPGKGIGERSGTINTVPTSSQIPRTHAFNDSVLTKPSSSNDAQQHRSSTRSDIRSDNTTEGNINEHKTSDNVNIKIQRAGTKKLSADKTMADVSLIKKATEIQVNRWNTKMPNTVFPETNKYDKYESSDPRVVSKVIPWWSSSDSFNKIRKKHDDRRSIAPTLNKTEKKDISNVDQDLATESADSASKMKETSNSKLHAKNVDSTHDAITNNSDDLTAYANSTDQHGTSKLSGRHPYPIRLKPNRANSSTIPQVTRTDWKTQDAPKSGTEEDDKKLSEEKQINPAVTSSTLDTTNKEIKNNVSSEKKISISSKRVETEKQNSSLKNQEQRSLKQTNSTTDESSMKSKIENIVDALKPIEKKKDGTLIDYGLKVSSRKLVTQLSEEKGNENQINKSMMKKDLITNQYDKAQQNVTKYNTDKTKRLQINKKISSKQTEADEVKKAEIKMNTLKKKDPTAKTIVTTDIKEQNKNDVWNMKNLHNNTTSNSSNLKDSTKLTQTLKKYEKLDENTIQNNSMETVKSLSDSDTHESHNLSNMNNSSGTIPKSKQLRTSIKLPSKKDRQKYLSNIGNVSRSIKIEESEKLNNLTSPKSTDNHHPSKELSNIKVEVLTKSSIDTNKNTNISEPLPQANPETSKTSHSDSINKKAEPMPNRSRNNVAEDKITKTITQNPNIKSSLPKDSEENQKSKSSKNKKNSFPSESNDSPKKTGSSGSKSSGSKMCMAFEVISNDI